MTMSERDPSLVGKQHEQRLQLGNVIITLMGPEGAGKTTIARRLAEEAKKPYITTGDILRHLAETDVTEIGDECRSMLAESRYLDPSMLVEILARRFSEEDVAEGFILDGGLRTVPEVETFPSILTLVGRVMPVKVIYLPIPPEMSLERLVHAPEARRRNDDTIERISNRLANFNKQLDERLALAAHHENWQLIEIDATGSHDDTYTKVRDALIPKMD